MFFRSVLGQARLRMYLLLWDSLNCHFVQLRLAPPYNYDNATLSVRSNLEQMLVFIHYGEGLSKSYTICDQLIYDMIFCVKPDLVLSLYRRWRLLRRMSSGKMSLSRVILRLTSSDFANDVPELTQLKPKSNLVTKCNWAIQICLCFPSNKADNRF